MVVTLKVISCAINYNDGLLKDKDFHEAQKKYRLQKLPSFIEYVGYCLCCGSHFAGPVSEMKDYLDWIAKEGIWARLERSPPPYKEILRALLQASACMALYIYLVSHYPLSAFNDPIYKEWAFLKRLNYQYMVALTARWKYYSIWSVSWAVIKVSGLGFLGWSNPLPSMPRWDRAKNVDIKGVELAKNAAELPLVWNMQVSIWLRNYVYDRLFQMGKRPGYFQLLATQTVSAVWHGLYPGYLIFFVQSTLLIAGSKVIYRWEQSVPQSLLVFFDFAYRLLVLDYSAVGFMVLSFHETIAAYQSIIPLIMILLGLMRRQVKAVKSKAMKEQ